MYFDVLYIIWLCLCQISSLPHVFFSSSGILQQWSRSEPLLAFPQISCQKRSIQLHAAVTKLGFLFTYLLFKYWIDWNLLSRCFSSSFTNYPTTIGEQELWRTTSLVSVSCDQEGTFADWVIILVLGYQIEKYLL